MIFHVLACDYDGTLAHHGRLDDQTAEALERVKRSGRKLMMVTGRELPDLQKVCESEKLDLFDAIVAENGALLYLPKTREERVLCDCADPNLVNELKKRGVSPISVGRAIIATWEPHEKAALDAIQTLGLEHTVIFNKGAVMILPPTVNKGTGLEAGLLELGYSRHNTVGMGDAENDHAFLSRCEFFVAVSNALPSLKERSDYVTRADHGDGVREFIDEHLLSDAKELISNLNRRHNIELGEAKDGVKIKVPAHDSAILITGGSGSGKSTLTGVLIERVVEDERSVCVIDPEGDYATLADLATVIVMGGSSDKPLPSPDELAQILKTPMTNIVLNLHALTLAEKTEYTASVLGTINRIRAENGRPHWLFIDETHHVMPGEGSLADEMMPLTGEGLCMITFDANLISPAALKFVKSIATRTVEELGIAVEAVYKARGLDIKASEALNPDNMPELEGDEAAIINIYEDGHSDPLFFKTAKRRTTHQRHIKKYATGELPEDRSFYFRGADKKLNLRAANLIRFGEIAQGVDDDTWLYHLKRGDYSKWIRHMIKNDDLADVIADIEKVAEKKQMSAQTSREAILDAINQRYAA